jgi:hypothetical protein
MPSQRHFGPGDVDHSLSQIDVRYADIFERGRPWSAGKREEMKFSTQWVLHCMKLSEPTADIAWSYPSLASMFPIPVNRRNRVHGRQIGVAFLRVVINRS